MTTSDPRTALDQIKARTADAFTDGAWAVDPYDTHRVVSAEANDDGGRDEVVTAEPSDAVFIAHARTDVDRLTKALEAVLDVADTFERNAEAYECGAEDGSTGITQANCLRSAAHIIRGQIAGRLNKGEQG